MRSQHGGGGYKPGWCRPRWIVQYSTYQIWATSVNSRLSYWRLTTDISSVLGGAPKLGWFQKRVDRSAPNLVGTLPDHRYTPSLKMVVISCSVSKPQRFKVERCWVIWPKIALFDPLLPRKYQWRGGEMSGQIIEAPPMTEPVVYIWWAVSPRLLSTVVR